MPGTDRERVLKPGLYGTAVAADSRRAEFDFGNEALLLEGVRPAAVFIGDSITHLWELGAFFAGSGKLLVNRGIGGDISDYVRRRFPADALQLSPELIVLLIGTNDLGWVLEAQEDQLVATVAENVEAMAWAAREGGIRMAICSVLPVWGPSWYPMPEFTDRKNTQIVALNHRLAEIAPAQDALWVDYHSRMTDKTGKLRADLADDGVHPHTLGYRVMAQTLREALAPHGLGL